MRNLLRVCSDTFEGRRNRALIALLADSGLRISEALHLRIEDVKFATRSIIVRGGKGGKDGVGFFGAETTQYLRTWLGKRRRSMPEDYLFVDQSDRTLTRGHATHLHIYYSDSELGVGGASLSGAHPHPTSRRVSLGPPLEGYPENPQIATVAKLRPGNY